jgi:hypothetical protein
VPRDVSAAQDDVTGDHPLVCIRRDRELDAKLAGNVGRRRHDQCRAGNLGLAEDLPRSRAAPCVIELHRPRDVAPSLGEAERQSRRVGEDQRLIGR